MPCVPMICGTFLCSFWGRYEHLAPFATWIRGIHWKATLLKVGEAVLGQGGGNIVLGTKLSSDGCSESVVTKMLFNYFP